MHKIPKMPNVLLFSSQVVLEKGLGMNGMSLASLKDEGFQAVFIGIGQ